jgi:hypothetical protein
VPQKQVQRRVRTRDAEVFLPRVKLRKIHCQVCSFLPDLSSRNARDGEQVHTFLRQ